MHKRYPAVPVLLLALGGCNVQVTHRGPEQHESRSIDLDKSERVRVELKMGGGELNVRGGAAKLLEADFTYNVAEWKPDVRYRAEGSAGDLVIEQHASTKISNQTKNRWDLRLNDTVPMDLRVEFGAGEGRMNIGSLSLRSVDVQMGAGELQVDLRGSPRQDYNAHIRGGVGEATVYLPKQVGIMATASGGIGEISVKGLQKSGDRWVNEAYQNAKVRVRVDVKGGVGQINLIAE